MFGLSNLCCDPGSSGGDGARKLLARLPHVSGSGSISETKSAAVYDMLFKNA
jgi:hypothetical protein